MPVIDHGVDNERLVKPLCKKAARPFPSLCSVLIPAKYVMRTWVRVPLQFVGVLVSTALVVAARASSEENGDCLYGARPPYPYPPFRTCISGLRDEPPGIAPMMLCSVVNCFRAHSPPQTNQAAAGVSLRPSRHQPPIVSKLITRPGYVVDLTGRVP